MLELRPSCELCATPLPADSDDARMCTYECTFCSRCATWELLGICPNCDGELVTRPRRPADKLTKDPASTAPVHAGHDVAEHQEKVLKRLHADDLPTQVWTVAFTSRRPANGAGDGYSDMAVEMGELVRAQPGLLGFTAVRSDSGEGINVSRWTSVAAMVNWRKVVPHQGAQKTGRERWYDWYRSDVARVDRTSEFTPD